MITELRLKNITNHERFACLSFNECVPVCLHIGDKFTQSSLQIDGELCLTKRITSTCYIQSESPPVF